MKGVIHTMKIICSKNNLLKSVNISLKAVPSKTTMPILECILMDATTNQIKFTTNDMELGIETIVDGQIEEKGMVALDAKIFYEIIRRLPDSNITIKTDSNYVATITCEKAKFTIPGKAGEDFAYLPVIEKDEALSLSQFTLKEMIRQTIFSIAVNENNRLMTGELFEIKDNCLKVVSLDGHRISIRKMPLKKDYADRKIVVPGKTLSEISKILSGEIDDQVSLYFTKNHILFEFDQTIVVSRLIEGEYFRIDQMLSSDYETKIKINKKDSFQTYYALNELRLDQGLQAQVIHVYIGNVLLEVFRGNGLCVSTPSGSTAYNKSLGGSIIYPGIPLMQLTEVAGIHHNAYRSLGSSLILDESQTIKLVGNHFNHSLIGIDHIHLELEDVESIEITIGRKYVRFIEYKEMSFIKRVRRAFINS